MCVYKTKKIKTRKNTGFIFLKTETYALSTFPLFKHLAQTYSFLTVPSAFLTLTFWRFASKDVGVLRLLWLTRFPDNLPLPQTLQTLLIINSSKGLILFEFTTNTLPYIAEKSKKKTVKILKISFTAENSVLKYARIYLKSLQNKKLYSKIIIRKVRSVCP